MENKKPKTIDEFFIEKYERLEEEIEVSKEKQEELLEMNYNLGEERDKWEEKYYELVERLKEDFEPKISTTKKGDVLIEFKHWTHFKEYSKLQYEFYKNLFNLTEEGEEENE